MTTSLLSWSATCQHREFRLLHIVSGRAHLAWSPEIACQRTGETFFAPLVGKRNVHPKRRANDCCSSAISRQVPMGVSFRKFNPHIRPVLCSSSYTANFISARLGLSCDGGGKPNSNEHTYIHLLYRYIYSNSKHACISASLNREAEIR